jgi:hypothetical protein
MTSWSSARRVYAFSVWSKSFHFRVHRLDQIEFPATLPFLELLLAGDRFSDVRVAFIPDERGNAIFAGECRADAVAVFDGASITQAHLNSSAAKKRKGRRRDPFSHCRHRQLQSVLV